MAKEKKRRKRKKKKRRVRKLFVSTAAFIMAAVVVIFCIHYVCFETSYFDIDEIGVTGNVEYDSDYIIDKSQIKQGEKIFNVDRDNARTSLEDETYVESARVVLELPSKILIELKEREEKYQIFYNNEYIVTDNYGTVLNIYPEKNDLITIESLTDVLYNIGDSIQFDGVENIQDVFHAIDYINSELEGEEIKNFTVDSDNSLLMETKYGTFTKIKIDEDIKYQILFAMKIINDRLNNNLDISNGLIDFTEGDSPVYTDDFKLEEHHE